MQIRELKDDGEIEKLAILHKKAFPTFFLTQLGLPFLKVLYKGYLDDKDSGIIVAVNGEKIIGFIAYSKDYPRFYKGLLKHKIIQFGWCAFLSILHHPSFTKRLFGAFKKSDSVVKSEKYVELASICVEPSMSGKGIGTKLIDYLKSITDYDEYAFINLETDAEHNDAANRFYEKNGFKLTSEFITAEGRRMNEYRFSPERSCEKDFVH